MDMSVALLRTLDTNTVRKIEIKHHESLGGNPLAIEIDERRVGALTGLDRFDRQSLQKLFGKPRSGFGWVTFDILGVMGADEPNYFHLDLRQDPETNEMRYRLRGVGLRTTTDFSFADDWHVVKNAGRRQ
jgi:hypothetical protein